MITGIDPKVDYAFKRIFGSEANTPILVDLLNAVLNPPAQRRIVAVTLQNPFNDKDQPEEKLSVLDIKARDQDGRHYNIEMQMCATSTYPERVLYYWARIYGRQLEDGDNYDELQETISISFVNGVLFADVPDFHLDFQLRSARRPGLIFSDRLEIHVVELPKFRKNPGELADSLDAWCFFLKNAADLDAEELPSGLQKPAVQKAMEVLTVISKTDLERERYEAQVRWERDRRADVIEREKALKAKEAAEKKAESAEKKAESAEKKAESAEKAHRQSIVDRIHLCQRVLKVPQTPPEELLTLAIEDLESKANALEQQLIAKT